MSNANTPTNGHLSPDEADDLFASLPAMPAPAGLELPTGKGSHSGTTGHITKRLRALYEQRAALQRQIDAFEFVLKDLHAVRTERKQKAVTTLVNQTITLERARKQHAPKPKTRKPQPKYANIKEQRATTARALAEFSTTEARPGSLVGRGLGAYVRRGYLKRKGDGYLRTAKEYVI